MSRIDIGEVRHFLTILKQANAEARVWLLQLKQTVERYVQDDSLSGKAVEASKSYFEASYPPLIETILQAFDTSEALLAQYIQEFHSQVDPSPNARIDAVLLGQAMEKVKSIRRKQEALQQSLSGSTAGLYEGRAQNLRLDFIEAVEQEKILEKYLQFEQSHTHFFEPLVELVQAAKRAVDVLRQQVHFNEETGTYTVAKTFAPAMKSLQDSLQKARGIDPKLDEQLEDYEILAVVYKDNTGKDAVMWVLEKDGVRVQNTKLQKYIEQTGRYQDAEKYTIITLADLDKKITKAWQKGTYYMNGKVYSGGTGKVLQASAYVQEWKGKLDESGLTDVVLGLGLSTAAIRYKEIKVDKQLITVSKYADFSSYKYNSTTNPGPLSKLENTPSKNFYGGRYNVEVLSEPRMLYRAGDAKNPFGQWFTESAPQSVATVRIDSAVKAQWLTKEGYWDNSYSNINTVFTLEIPAGTTIYKGPVGTQGGIYQGGLNKEQIFIYHPWENSKIKVRESYRINK